MEVQIKPDDLECVNLTEADFIEFPSENGRIKETGDKDAEDLSRYTVKFCQGEYHWTEKRIFDMIKIYKEYVDKNTLNPANKKTMWDYISAQMREIGHEKCTTNHVQNKYKTLTRQYRIVCDHNAIPGRHRRTFPYFDVMSEVYEYTPSKHTGTDDIDSEDESCGGQKLTSLLVNINKDKKEQEEKKLEKLELMHREKMDMFSSFLETISKKANAPPQASVSTRTSKRLSASPRKRPALPLDNEFVSGDFELDDESSVNQECVTSSNKSATKRLTSNNKVSKMASQSTSELTSLIMKMDDERKEREELKMKKLEKMHDEKMKMFSAFLDVIKKMNK